MNRSAAALLVSPMVTSTGAAGMLALAVAMAWCAAQHFPGYLGRLLAT